MRLSHFVVALGVQALLGIVHQQGLQQELTDAEPDMLMLITC